MGVDSCGKMRDQRDGVCFQTHTKQRRHMMSQSQVFKDTVVSNVAKLLTI